MSPTACQSMAQWAANLSWENTRQAVRDRIKLHLLDALGCAIGALSAPPMRAIREDSLAVQIPGPCTRIGGGATSPERAAFYNGALVRHLEYSDTFVAGDEICYPADNVAPLLAAAEMVNSSGRDFLRALLIAYHAQCRVTAALAHLNRPGFDQTLQLALSQAVGLSCVLGLSAEQAAHSIAICAAGGFGPAGIRASAHPSQWTGLAAASTAFSTIHNTLLAASGVTGPLDIFETQHGLEDLLGKSLKINWAREHCDLVLHCNLKRYNASFQAQTCIDALLKLRQKHTFEASEVKSVHVDTFKAACETQGKDADAAAPKTREAASHSLQHLIAVALLDGAIGPPQLEASRIEADDVQQLRQKVHASSSFWFSRAYPRQMLCNLSVELRDGRRLTQKSATYRGFHSNPMPVGEVDAKFESLAAPAGLPTRLMHQIESCVLDLENRPLRQLTNALASIQVASGHGSRAA